MSVNLLDDDRPLADRAGHPLDRPTPHIAHREDTRRTGRESGARESVERGRKIDPGQHIAALVELDGASQPAAARLGADQCLALERHRIAVGGPDYRIRDQQEIAERATAVTGTLTTLLGGVAAISLIVGGIGIMNIMLVSVTERTREIGLRLAVGARTQDVLRQFLLEAVAVSVLSGLVGVVCGILGSQLLGQIKDWPIQVSPQAIFLAVGFSAMLGIFFGFYPARRAAQLEPIEALRYE